MNYTPRRWWRTATSPPQHNKQFRIVDGTLFFIRNFILLFANSNNDNANSNNDNATTSATTRRRQLFQPITASNWMRKGIVSEPPARRPTTALQQQSLLCAAKPAVVIVGDNAQRVFFF